jgi:enhancing lycopene biosynthesis protein 2
MKIGVLLSGCGVYDGAEIQESIFTLLAIEESGMAYQCIGVDALQHHVINHLNGAEMSQERNMLVEAARIARGNIVEISTVTPADYDALVIPGGFGSAKNFTKWAFEGPNGEIDDRVKLLLVNMYNAGKPIVALCVSPVVVAKALEGSIATPHMTIGSAAEASPYEISGFEAGLQATGVETVSKTIREIQIDKENRLISAPCYMMEASLSEVRNNISQAIQALKEMLHEA